MVIIRELADRGSVTLIKHIQKNDAESMIFSGFSKMIGWFDKNGNPQANGAGKEIPKQLPAINHRFAKYNG